jgi:hypothetical protein
MRTLTVMDIAQDYSCCHMSTTATFVTLSESDTLDQHSPKQQQMDVLCTELFTAIKAL